MRYTEEYWNEIERILDSISNIEKIYGRRVLITGATGMICSSVVEVLLHLNRSRGADIEIFLAGRSKARVNQRFEDFAEGKDYCFVSYDAEEFQELDIKVDYVIHGASNANPAAYSLFPVETIYGNVVGMKSIMESAVHNGWGRILYISSSEVYGKKASSAPYMESDFGYVNILNARACYPNAKRLCETICASYAQEYGIDFVVVRPGHIYGHTITRADNRASAQFTWKALIGENIVMKSPGTQHRSYCYTLDCASAIITVLLNGGSGEAYNISNVKSISTIREIAEMIAKISGVEVKFELPTDSESKSYNLMENSSLDSSKLEALGWNGIYNLHDGVAKTIELMKKNMHN